jgi:hypothetical protein
MLITQGKTNWKLLLVVIILAVIVGSGALWYSVKKEQSYQLPEIKKPAKVEEPYIKVISPNGGEQWIIGKKYDITWESQKVDKVYIYLVKEGESDVAEIITKVFFQASLGKYSWIIPSDNNDINSGGQFKIVITSSEENNGKIRDESDNYFGIIKDETANWKTYENEEYGFEIKYPQMLEFSFPAEEGYAFECGKQLGDSFRLASTLHFGPTIYDFTVYSNPGHLSPEDFFICKMNGVRQGNFNKEESIINIEDLTIGNQKIQATKITWELNFINVLIPKENIIIEIEGQPGSGDEKLSTFNQMLSTFRFLE